MKQSRNVAMAFLLGTFLTGGVLGFSANRYMSRDQVCTTKARGGSSTALVRMLGDRLQLDSAQSRAVDSILDTRAQQYREAMLPLRPKMDSIKFNARDQIRRVLTEAQRLEFEALLKEMNDSTRKSEDHE